MCIAFTDLRQTTVHSQPKLIPLLWIFFLNFFQSRKTQENNFGVDIDRLSGGTKYSNSTYCCLLFFFSSARRYCFILQSREVLFCCFLFVTQLVSSHSKVLISNILFLFKVLTFCDVRSVEFRNIKSDLQTDPSWGFWITELLRPYSLISLIVN